MKKVQHFDGFPRLSDYPSYGHLILNQSKDNSNSKSRSSILKWNERRAPTIENSEKVLPNSPLENTSNNKTDLSLNIDISSLKK